MARQRGEGLVGREEMQHGQVQLCWFFALTLKKRRLVVSNREKMLLQGTGLLPCDWLISQRAIVQVYLIK